MNQIINTKKNKFILKKFFRIQLIISLILIIILLIIIIDNLYKKDKEIKKTNVIMLNAKLSSVFKGNNKYFGRIIISKINLDYYVYNSYSEEMLKILPCKFYGNNLEDYGNICIIGHNYFDDRFFSNLNKLSINDKIEIQDLNQNKYIYTIFNIYEIDENNIENVISQDKDKYLLTLCTCTFNKKKRLIIKAVR